MWWTGEVPVSRRAVDWRTRQRKGGDETQSPYGKYKYGSALLDRFSSEGKRGPISLAVISSSEESFKSSESIIRAGEGMDSSFVHTIDPQQIDYPRFSLVFQVSTL